MCAPSMNDLTAPGLLLQGGIMAVLFSPRILSIEHWCWWQFVIFLFLRFFLLFLFVERV